MATFSLSIKIDPDDLKEIRERGFNFCITRNIKYGQTEQRGNFVFSGMRANQVLYNIACQWKDNLQIFGATEHQNPIVRIVTKPAQIQGGQQAIIDANGNIQVTGTPQLGQPFRVVNDWAQMANIGVGFSGAMSGTYNPFFLSPPIPMHTMTNILPTRKYSIFWDPILVPGAAFDKTATPPFSFEFTSTNRITITYIKGNWSIVN